jgi:ribosomal protein S6--L-glutamate ligase
VGWREWVALPDLQIPAIKTKIDTGAKSSCLHAHNVRAINGAESRLLTFEVTPLREHSSFILQCQAEIVDERQVRSSNGVVSLRPFIRTTLALGGQQWPIEISLADRRKMKFPMLLGREAMQQSLVVLPRKSYVQGRKLPHCYREHGLPKKRKSSV